MISEPKLNMRLGWMREIISNPIKQKSIQSRYTQQRCIGHFFDSVTRKTVHIDMGFVSVRIPFVFRAVSSSVSNLDFLERFEGTAQSAEKKYGSYVIPVQSPMGRTKSC